MWKWGDASLLYFKYVSFWFLYLVSSEKLNSNELEYRRGTFALITGRFRGLLGFGTLTIPGLV